MSDESSHFDVLIVGGGPAGLSAALVLGRCRRRVALFDAGHPRNAASRAMHGFLSRDGMPPGEFLQVCREQLARYPNVHFFPGEVTAAEREGGGFRIQLGEGAQAQGELLLLATGLVDELPDLAGIEAFYGRSVHHCPYCDGWEWRDQPLAIHGGKQAAADLALELRLWSQDLVLCSDGPVEFPDRERARLEALGIGIRETPIAALEGEDGALRGLRFADSSFLERRALFFSPGQWQRSPFAAQLGCRFNPEGAIECGADAATGVPGVYAAGNASRGLQLVILAAAEGTLAAFHINQALLAADTARALKAAGKGAENGAENRGERI